MNKLLIIFFLSISIFDGFSQTAGKLSIGLAFGPTFNRTLNGPPNFDDKTVSWSNKFTMGILAKYTLTKHFSIQSGCYLNRFVHKIRIEGFSQFKNGFLLNIGSPLNTIEFPIILNYHFTPKITGTEEFFIFSGMSYLNNMFEGDQRIYSKNYLTYEAKSGKNYDVTYYLNQHKYDAFLLFRAGGGIQQALSKKMNLTINASFRLGLISRGIGFVNTRIIINQSGLTDFEATGVFNSFKGDGIDLTLSFNYRK